MGVGKSTVASQLASRLNCSFCDLDTWIAEQTGASPAEHILGQGEAFFRQLELRSLVTVLKNPPPIIALGGGTLHINGCKALLSSCDVVVLECRLDVIVERIINSSRPLARHAESLYEQRSKDYLQFPNRIDVTELSVDDIIDKLLIIWAYNENT